MSILRNCCIILAALTFTLGQSAIGQDSATNDATQDHHQYSPGVSHAAFIVQASNQWLQKYAKLKPRKQKLLKRIAKNIANFRRNALKLLIQRSPEDAFELSLSPVQRQGLPNFILGRLETRIHTTGDLVLSITETLPRVGDNIPQNGNDPLPVVQPTSTESWSARIGQSSFEAYVYGNRLRHQTKFDTPIHGVVLDDQIAISESPLYQYDLLETVQLGFNPDQIVATSGGGQPIPLPDIQALEKLEQDLLADVLRFGPLPMPFNPNEWTMGIKNLLVIRVMYSGDPREPPYSESDIVAFTGWVNSFFIENSQGLTSFNTTVISDIYELQDIEIYREFGGLDTLEIDALAAAASNGIDPDDYDRILILAPLLIEQPMEQPLAVAAVGGKVVIVAGETPDLRVSLAHELGHTYGFKHSDFLFLFSKDLLGPSGDPLGYGDAWDIMGAADLEDAAGNPQRRHFNAFFKTLAGWLPDTAVSDGTLGGDFRLRAHDAETPVGTRAIIIESGDGSTYWLGRRSLFLDNTSMLNGIEVRRVDNLSSGDYEVVLLLDLDQGDTPDFRDARVFHSLVRSTIGATDTVNGFSIRVITLAEDHLGDFARVLVTRE